MSTLILVLSIGLALLVGCAAARMIGKLLRPTAAAQEIVAEKNKEDVAIGHAYLRAVGRRRPCPCFAMWPAGHPLAGQRKAIRSCCAKYLAADPALKGSPLPKASVDRVVDIKMMLAFLMGRSTAPRVG